MSSPPGVMIYHEMRPAIAVLDDAQRGQLFFAILEYSDLGVLPEFSGDAILVSLWSLVKPKIDLDHTRYEAKIEQCRRAVAAREAKRRQQSDAIGRYPTSFSTLPTAPPLSPSPSQWAAPHMSDLEFEEKRRRNIALLQSTF